jgi:polyisoprenoid-binding protein YceI
VSTAVEPFTGSYIADPDHSSFLAVVRHMGVGTFRTAFDDVEVRLEQTPSGPRLTGRARVESIGIKNPPEFRAHVVEGADFFDAGNHPYISFESQRLDLGPDGALELQGTLTIKGHARPITATGRYSGPVEDPFGGTRVGLDLSTAIDRRDFGMEYQAVLPQGGDGIGWKVEISVQAELIRDSE